MHDKPCSKEPLEWADANRVWHVCDSAAVIIVPVYQNGGRSKLRHNYKDTPLAAPPAAPPPTSTAWDGALSVAPHIHLRNPNLNQT